MYFFSFYAIRPKYKTRAINKEEGFCHFIAFCFLFIARVIVIGNLAFDKCVFTTIIADQ